MAGLIGIGQSALMAAYAQLQTTGHNIANANTPGYSRQEAILATAGGYYTGGGFLGSGVDLVTVQRRYDQFLTAELGSQSAAAAAAGKRAEMLGRIDRLLADTDNGLGVAYDELGSALADVVNRPFDPSARQAVLTRADALAQRLRGLDGELRQLGRETEQRIAQSAGSANLLLDGIARLNERIAQAGGSHAPNDLLDERDAMLLELNGYLKATSYTQDDGTVTVFAAGGEGLVVGNRAAKLAVEPDPIDPARQRVVLETGSTRLPLGAASLGGGAIAGLLQFRDGDLQAARTRVGQLAAGLAGAYNAQQSAGLDASGEPGQPMFALGVPEVLASSRNGGDAKIGVRVVDGTKVAASDYAIRYEDAAGGPRYTLTRLSDGQSWQHDDPSTPLRVDGLEFVFPNGSGSATGTPVAGDSFVVRSASVLAAGFTAVLGSGARLATGLAMTAELGAANTGDLTVRGFELADPADPDRYAAASLRYIGGNAFELRRGDPPASTGTTIAWNPGEPLAYGGWTIAVQGRPEVGDTIDVVAVADPSTDNRNARAMVALAESGIVGDETFSDAFAALLVDAGTRAESAQATEAVSQRLLGDARAAHASQSGVNLDEEAARLMQYQQMYQAAARVIQAAQSMFDALLGATAR
ncbi:MAG: flagellar hook-associated protein FlgK [Limnobacter sp.]|nr:flagellar hook-associated protein FlgK [Limnobacter sp.]